MEKKNIIINGIKEEIFISIPNDEIEDNTDLINLENTLDLSEVLDNE